MKMLGITVCRKDTSHIVWSGFTEDDRVNHKKFIMEIDKNESELPFFKDVEDDVLIDYLGQYTTSDGRVFKITSIGHIDCYGYEIKLVKGKYKQSNVPVWFYLNGDSFKGSIKLVSKIYR